jgi:hypothetical protein
MAKIKKRIIYKREYVEAIKILKLGMTQISPDDKPCAICGSKRHFAYECSNNILMLAECNYDALLVWRCFHCGRVFDDIVKAEEHFGESSKKIVECLKG